MFEEHERRKLSNILSGCFCDSGQCPKELNGKMENIMFNKQQKNKNISK